MRQGRSAERRKGDRESAKIEKSGEDAGISDRMGGDREDSRRDESRSRMVRAEREDLVVMEADVREGDEGGRKGE